MAFFFSPLGNSQLLDVNGNNLNGGKIFTYLAGTSTPVATYTSITGVTPQANPIILNTLGLPASPIWLNGGVPIKMVIQDSAGVAIMPPVDNISGINDTTLTPTEWTSSGFVPTYISATSFAVPGDQTSTLEVGRRLRTNNTAGLIYSTIASAVFAASVTTVVVTNDSGVLDSGLSVISYAVLSALNRSLPSVVGGNNTSTMYTTGGTATAFTIAPNPASTAYVAGQSWWVTLHTAAGLNPTLQVSGVSTPPNLVSRNVDGTFSNISSNMPAASYRITLVSATQAVVEGLIITSADSRVLGLVGAPTTATPLTKYDLSADSVVLRNAKGGTVARYVTGTITNDLGLAGVTANGRDQAAVFAISTWIYLYFIWNGTTLATISSLAVPTTGPALPTGYTHWAFAGSVRWNAVSNIIPGRMQGNAFWYDIATGGVNRALSAGVATTFTAITMSGLIPPNALEMRLFSFLSYTHNVVLEFILTLRPVGAANAGQVYLDTVTQVPNQLNAIAIAFAMFPGTSSNIEYKLNASPSTSGGAYVDVLGYTTPNGG